MTYKEIIEEVERKMFALDPKVEALYTTIRTLKDLDDPHGVKELIQFPESDENVVKRRGYKKNDITANKILFVLNDLGKFSRSAEIFNRIREYEPTFKSILNTAFNNLKDSKSVVIIRASKSNRDTFYGLKGWLNEDGKIKPDFMYDENSLISKEITNAYDDIL